VYVSVSTMLLHLIFSTILPTCGVYWLARWTAFGALSLSCKSDVDAE